MRILIRNASKDEIAEFVLSNEQLLSCVSSETSDRELVEAIIGLVNSRGTESFIKLLYKRVKEEVYEWEDDLENIGEVDRHYSE